LPKIDQSWPTQPAPKADHRNGSSGDPIGSPFAITAIIFAVAKRCRRCLAARWSRTAKDSHRLLGPNIEIQAQGEGVAVGCMCHTDDESVWQMSEFPHCHIISLFSCSATSELMPIDGAVMFMWPNGIRKRFKLQLDTRWSTEELHRLLNLPSQQFSVDRRRCSHAAASSDVFCLTRSP